MDALRKSGDSVGARVDVVADGVPPGWGEPIYGKLDGELAAALMSINAVKGVEIGDGFAVVAQKGSEHRDQMTPDGFASQPRRRHPRRHLHRPAAALLGRVQADLEPAPAGRQPRHPRQRRRSRHHRPPRSLRRHPRHADLRGDGRAGADGPGAAPSRAVRRRRRRVAAHPGRPRRRQTIAASRVVPRRWARAATAPRDRPIQPIIRASGQAAHGIRSQPAARPVQDTQHMSKTVTVAVVGATGAVGETMLKILAERNFPVGKLHVLASERSAGGEVALRRQASWWCRTWPRSIRPASTSRCSRPAAASRRSTRRSSPPPARW